MEFLWVRWLGIIPACSFGRKQAKLLKIGFIPDSDDFAFGFLDPAFVTQGCHLLPSFVGGKTTDLLATKGPTETRREKEGDDWSNFYVGM